MIIVYDPNTRKAMFTYDEPHPAGITELLDTLSHNYVVNSTTIPIQLIYVEEDGSISQLLDFPVTVNKTAIAADGTDQCVISGVPANTAVSVDGNAQGTFADTFSFAATEEGTYTVLLTNPRYIDYTVEVTAS